MAVVQVQFAFVAEVPYEERLTLAVWFEFAEELFWQFEFVETEALQN